MTATDLLEREGFKWRAFAHVDKYSVDQSAHAERLLLREGHFPERMISAASTAPGLRSRLHGLLTATGAPEDGTAEAAGNLLVTVGLDAITKLLTAIGGAQAFSGPTRSIVGVGATATAATIADTALGSNGASAWYQGCDSSNPTQANGVITTICTFASGDGNFAWNEWCWATCTGAITPSATLASVATGTKLWNHKIASLGTKGAGAAWVFTTTVTIA